MTITGTFKFQIFKSFCSELLKVCDVCGFATVYGYALAAHKKSVHEKAKDFACDLCDYATHTKQVREPENNLVKESDRAENRSLKS